MTKEEMLKEIKEHKQKMQLDFVNDLLNLVEYYGGKTIKVDYVPSEEERYKFGKIVHMVNGINKYL